MALDIIIIVLIASGFYWGFSKGIIRTFFAIVSIAVSLVIASKFATNIADLLIGTFDFNPSSAFVIGLMILFFACLILVRFIGTRVEALFTSLNINSINKIAGGILMGLIFLMLTTLGVKFMEDKNQFRDYVAQSSVYPLVEPFGKMTYNFWLKMQPELKKYQETVTDSLEDVRDSKDDYMN